VGTLSWNADLVFAPARRRGHEILDDPSQDPALAHRSLRDIALANRLFGGQRAVLREVRAVLIAAKTDAQALTRSDTRSDEPLMLLDIGTGLGDIPLAATRMAVALGRSLHTIGLELSPHLAREADRVCTSAVAGDALRLPFADDSVEIVTCSQVLHHFEDAEAVALLRECTRVARRAVIIADLRRSWLAVAGLWTSSFALGFHPVSRHDGVVSILRGFTRDDLGALVERATGCRPRVRHALGWRVTATWTPQLLSA